MSDAPGSAGLRLFEPRRAAIALSTLLAIQVFAFFAFYPAGVTIADEGTYVRQAQLMLAGSTAIESVDPFTGDSVEFRPISRYPLGTALLLLPFVAVGGREAACLASLLCTVLGVALTARWLRDAGRSPLWAALLLVYPQTIVFSRLAMSEAASLFVVALGLWLYWRGRGRSFAAGAPWLFAAGVAGGASFAFREANVLLFAPLFLGALLRRDAAWPALVAGGLLGLGVRAVSAWLFFGDPFFTKPPDPFALDAIANAAPLYLFCLVVLVPGGLVAGLAYRGERRAEIVSTVVIFVVFHLAYAYSGESSGWAKRLILGPRYFIPLLPLLAFASAEVWPRLATSARARAGAAGPRLESLAGALVISSVAAVALLGVGVQWAHANWGRDQATIRDAILEQTQAGAVVVTNWKATGKFIDLVGDERVILSREGLGAASVERLLDEHESFYVVLLDRSDSDFWRRNAFDNQRFVSGLSKRDREPARRVELRLDLRVTPTDRLRVWWISD